MRRLLLVLSLAACAGEPETPLECTTAPLTERLEAIDPAGLAIHLDAEVDENLRIASADLERYLGQLWGGSEPAIKLGAPTFDRERTLWFSTSEAARALAGANLGDDGFVLKRVEQSGSIVYVAWAPDDTNLAYAIYELLEELGVRFFHPLQEYVPALGGAYLPRALDRTVTPAFRVRGIHLHTLHPIEWYDAFNGSTSADLAEAKRFIDWLVKTGQNHVQWPILATMDLEAWQPHARAIVAYAHSRGVTTGVEPLLFAASALQNNFILARSDQWEPELEASLELLAGVGFDQVEIALGEFLSEDPEEVVRMLDHAVAHLADVSPTARISAVNHIGNFPNLWVDYRGERVFFYFLPARADERLIQSVHTVFFYDLYRGWGAYGHEDFSMHREFLFEQLAAGRTVRYKPESAYWVSADVDVPIFLPEYIHSRWVDIHGLTADVRERGLPPIDGHVTFSSGHEWGYWMTDYLAAKMMWAPERELADFYAHYAAAFGSCADRVQAGLTRFTELQSEYLFDRRLIPYLSGDDFHDDLGAVAGFVTIPARRSFQEVLAMTPDERARFHDEVVVGLQALAEGAAAIEAELDRTCEAATEAMGPWCRELRDGVAIVRHRARQSASLYGAIERTRAAPDEARAHLDEAERAVADAEQVIARREQEYRFDAERLTGARINPTIYRYGYLRQAHLACYWHRQALQATHLVETQTPALISDLPQCLE